VRQPARTRPIQGRLADPRRPHLGQPAGQERRPERAHGAWHQDRRHTLHRGGWGHQLHADGAIKGSGQIGSTKAIPATLFGQYRFGEANATWRPYVGAGPTYAKFTETTGNGTLTALTNPGGPGTSLKIKDKLGYSIEAGITYAFSPKCFADLTVIKTKLKTTSTLSTGQTIDVTLDPVTVGFYVGFKY